MIPSFRTCAVEDIDRPAASPLAGKKFEFDEASPVAVRCIPDHAQHLDAPSGRHGTVCQCIRQLDQVFDDAEQALPLLLPRLCGLEDVGVRDGSSTICEKFTARAAASG